MSYFADRYKTRDESLVQAYWSGHYTLAQVGEHFGVSYATVNRAVKQRWKGGGQECQIKACSEWLEGYARMPLIPGFLMLL